jgi:RNA polymerase sigma-70 factor (ECF subfamily)
MQSTQAALRLCGKCRTLKNARAFFKLSDYSLKEIKKGTWKSIIFSTQLVRALSHTLCVMTNEKNEFSNTYQEHVKMVYRICFTYMKNVADTEDAVADTFLKLLKRNPAFKSDEHEKAWIIRAAVNVCKDSLKSKWRYNENISDYENTPSLRSDTFFSRVEADEVAQAVLALPEKYKSVIYLCYYEGYSGKEIAGILKKPHSTIRSHLREAKEILRERLGDYNEFN